MRQLNMRAIRAGFYSTICCLPGLRDYLNYYRDAAEFEQTAAQGSTRVLKIDPVNDYGIVFTEEDIDGILRCEDVSAESLMLAFKMARFTDVSILGSSGITVDNRSGKALGPDGLPGRLHPNWVVARPLKAVHGNPLATYVNLLWMRKGHRHFFHFFLDVLVPVLVYLKNWHDREDRVVFLVREDLSAIQRDTYRFIEQDYPDINVRTVAPDEKLVCEKSIQVLFQHKLHGVANGLAREYLRDMAEFFVRHYEVAAPPSGPGRRLFLSREGAATRRVTNEPELIAMLSRYGFEAYETGSMPFKRQIELFREADFIVAPHGAALTNLIFCRPGTRVLSFFPAGYSDDCYLRLSKAMELDYHYLFGAPGDYPKRNHRMEPDELEAALTKMTAS